MSAVRVREIFYGTGVTTCTRVLPRDVALAIIASRRRWLIDHCGMEPLPNETPAYVALAARRDGRIVRCLELN